VRLVVPVISGSDAAVAPGRGGLRARLPRAARTGGPGRGHPHILTVLRQRYFPSNRRVAGEDRIWPAPRLTSYARGMGSGHRRKWPAKGLPDPEDDKGLPEGGPQDGPEGRTPLDQVWRKEARNTRRRRAASKALKATLEMGLEVLSNWP